MRIGRFKLLLLASLLIFQAACSRQSEQAPTPAPQQQSQATPPAPPPEPPPSLPPAETPAPPEPLPSEAPKPRKTPAPVPAPKPAKPDPALLDPALARAKAPEQFRVKFETTKGNVVLQVNRAWAPSGADRFFNLVKMGYYNDVAFFRVIDGFMAQFGINGDPKVSEKWRSAQIPDDPVKESNERGAISFATAGPNTRTTQLFINYGDNSMLNSQGFAPFGKVVQGMDVVDNLYKGYGEGAPRGGGPNQGLLQSQGNSYLRAQFPKLDYIKRASIIK